MSVDSLGLQLLRHYLEQEQLSGTLQKYTPGTKLRFCVKISQNR